MEGERIGQVDRNNVTFAHWMPKWVKNAILNYPTLAYEDKKTVKKIPFGTSTHGSIGVDALVRYPLTPGLVCGSGPSLDDMLPFIKDFPGKVFCGSSNLMSVSSSGRDPDYLICLDSSDVLIEQFKQSHLTWKNTVLVTQPSIDPAILKFWKGPRKYFRPLQIGDPFFEKIYPLMFPFIDTAFLNAGCTINTELEIANYIGCWPIFIAGVDYGFTDGRHRCAQYEYDGQWKAQSETPLITKYPIRIGENGCPTNEEFIAYKQNFFLVARSDAIQVYTCSRGLIRPDEVMGYVAPKDVANFCLHPPKMASQEECTKIYDKALQEMGIVLKDNGKGVLTVQSVEDIKKNPVRSEIAFISEKGTSFPTKDGTEIELKSRNGEKTVKKRTLT